MSQTSKTVQNDMLNKLRKAHWPVTVYLCNGIKLASVVIASFDMYTVAIRTAGETRLVSKSSIATILPDPNPGKTKYHGSSGARKDVSIPATPCNRTVNAANRRARKFVWGDKI